MASVQFEEFQCPPDVFSPFPSSPEQVAVFSPGSSSGSEDEHYLSNLTSFYFEPFQQHELQAKLSNAMANRQKRRAATSAVPMGNPRQLKGDYVAPNVVFSNHFGHISEACYPLDPPMSSGLSLESFAAFDMGSSSAAPSLMAYAAIPPREEPSTSPSFPSRVKSTTPNVALLFSLFDVLQPAPLEVGEVAAPAAARPHEARSPPAQVPELLPATAAGTTPCKAFYPAPTSDAARHYEAPAYHWAQEQEEVCLADYDHPLSSY